MTVLCSDLSEARSLGVLSHLDRALWQLCLLSTSPGDEPNLELEDGVDGSLWLPSVGRLAEDVLTGREPNSASCSDQMELEIATLRVRLSMLKQ